MRPAATASHTALNSLQPFSMSSIEMSARTTSFNDSGISNSPPIPGLNNRARHSLGPIGTAGITGLEDPDLLRVDQDGMTHRVTTLLPVLIKYIIELNDYGRAAALAALHPLHS